MTRPGRSRTRTWPRTPWACSAMPRRPGSRSTWPGARPVPANSSASCRSSTCCPRSRSRGRPGAAAMPDGDLLRAHHTRRSARRTAREGGTARDRRGGAASMAAIAAAAATVGVYGALGSDEIDTTAFPACRPATASARAPWDGLRGPDLETATGWADRPVTGVHADGVLDSAQWGTRISFALSQLAGPLDAGWSWCDGGRHRGRVVVGGARQGYGQARHPAAGAPGGHRRRRRRHHRTPGRAVGPGGGQPAGDPKGLTLGGSPAGPEPSRKGLNHFDDGKRIPGRRGKNPHPTGRNHEGYRKRTATAAGGVLAAAASPRRLRRCGIVATGTETMPALTRQSRCRFVHPSAPSPSVKASTSAPAACGSRPRTRRNPHEGSRLGRDRRQGVDSLPVRQGPCEAGTAISNCKGACAQKWPPVLVHGKPVLKGLRPRWWARCAGPTAAGS